MTNKWTRIVSSIASLSLGVALLGGMVAANAADEPTRNLSVEFMGRGAAPEETSPGKAKLSADDVGNEFWVGVAVDNVNDLSLFTDGMYSLELAFEYDSSFLEPYMDWDTALNSGNLKDGTNDTAWWNSSQYEIISVKSTDIDTESDRENKDVSTTRRDNGWKMCTICITLKDGVSTDSMRFNGLAVADKQYLAKLPFTLKKVPAESDTDQNPTVLSMVRGPSTFDIGSGTDGTNPYASWEATVTDATDQTNLKNLFTFTGDISLFGTGSELENMVVSKTDLADDETPINYTVSVSKDLNEDGFKTEDLEYYVSVPNETQKIKLTLTAAEMPDVKANTANVTSTLVSDKTYETDAISLNELDKDVEVDGYNNTVTITIGSTTYTVHIRRLLEPKIVLNYGNSPYGEIMKNNTSYPDDDSKQEAKTDFDTTLKFNGLSYYSEAWNDYLDFDNGEPYNGDKDETSIFVYQRKNFKDPGFIAYDSEGNTVESENVSISLSVTAFAGGIPKYNSSDAPNVVTEDANGNEHIFTLLKTVNVRPDVYIMKYSFTDNLSGKTVEVNRKLIAVSKLGDARIDANDIVNNLDASAVKSNSTYMNSANTIYRFKICDAKSDGNKIINNIDASSIKSSGLLLPLFYNILPET